MERVLKILPRLAIATGLLCATCATVAAFAPARVTGAEVQRAIRRGVRTIVNAQRPDGTWRERNYPGGQTCLAALALLQAGHAPTSTSLQRALPHIQAFPNRHTYVVSLKLQVLAAADPQHYAREIGAAADWLIKAQNKTGLWGYTETGDRFDHSNSQFALLGLHAAAQAGVPIPDTVWRRAEQRILRSQNADGGWAYQDSGRSYGSMTAAGLADLYIVGNQPFQRREKTFRDGAAPRCGRYNTNRKLIRAQDWLGRNFAANTNPRGHGSYVNYWLYAVERCGILSGRRYFGPHDWYRAGAAHLVRTQRSDGLWNRNLVDTCLGVLFLAKGHKSLLIQKLRWSDDDEWNPDRNDVAHLVAHIDDQLGQPVAWQVVDFDAPLEDWLAAPILYFHGHEFPEWDVTQRDKLRAYVEQGGLLFAEACCSRAEFRAGFEQFAANTFPETPLRVLGPDHAVYRVRHELEPYDLRGVDFGCRTSVLFSPHDLSCLWEQGDVPILSEYAFQLGTNIAAYAIGKRPLRDRLDAVVLPSETPAKQRIAPQPGAFRLAQVAYEGDWRPFPLALVRFAEFLRDELSFDVVTEYRQVRLTDSELYRSPVLYLAGHFDFELPIEERTALRDHLRRGGFLIADACCGTQPFDGAFRRLVRQMFPEATLQQLPLDHPVFQGRPGFDVRQVKYSPDVVRTQPDRNEPELWGLEIDGRLVTVYSPYSLGCGLTGEAFDGCWGLASEDARRLAANIILYAVTH